MLELLNSIALVITWIAMFILLVMWTCNRWIFKWDSPLLDAIYVKPLKKMIFKPITDLPLSVQQRALLARMIATDDCGSFWRVKVKGLRFYVHLDGRITSITTDTPADEPVGVDNKSLDKLMIAEGQIRLRNLTYLLDNKQQDTSYIDAYPIDVGTMTNNKSSNSNNKTSKPDSNTDHKTNKPDNKSSKPTSKTSKTDSKSSKPDSKSSKPDSKSSKPVKKS